MRISLGNMPPNSIANLRAFCHQKLELADQSYCLRIPFAYVPAYLGNMSNMLSMADEVSQQTDPELYSSCKELLDIESMPVKSRSSGLWDIMV